MYYCKNLEKLTILSLFEGEIIGTVNKLYFDRKLKKLCEIEIVSEEGLNMILPVKNVYNVGKNALTIKNNQAIILKNSLENGFVAPIGVKAYSIAGEFLGVVDEITLTQKFIVEKIALDNGAVLDVKFVASCGKNTIVFNNMGEKFNLKNFMPEIEPKTFKKEEVEIANAMPVESEEKSQEIEEKKIVQNSDFLLGRICVKDITNFNNEILIKANTVINKKNLKEINKYGKLKELMIYSK